MWMSPRLTGQVSCLKQLIYEHLYSVSFLPLEPELDHPGLSLPLQSLGGGRAGGGAERADMELVTCQAAVEPMQRSMADGTPCRCPTRC